MPVGAALPLVHSCEASMCAYNGGHACHAAAITVGNSGSAACETFLGAEVRGGTDDAHAAVGACHESSCVHNERLECSAPAIDVDTSAGHAVCLTFARA
ncbi:DUF1540 domain-containing protein [Aquipuribacter hungaricus]|uniref:DUF1540 domain-containing protein n=1 Tax=Aquipuribacter hungaricus TaxID=545624 RepID=A0ABV7WH85_9MICO